MNGSAPTGSETPLLRVRHFVDGRAVATPSRRTFELVHQAVDLGRHGVPIASPDEVAQLVERCGDGLARWLAIGVIRRRQILRDASAALRDRTMDLAEAYADDDNGISTIDTVAAAIAVIDTMIAAVDEAHPSPLRPGIYVYRPSSQQAGRGFVPLVWPLLLGGSTVIQHPQLDKPRIGQAYAMALSEAGLPDGVVNLIYGDHETTVALLGDPAIAGVLGVGPRDHASALTEVADAFGKRWLTELLFEPLGAPG